MAEWQRVDGPKGLTLTEKQARALSTRLMLQLPKDMTPRQIAEVARDLDSRVKGLPPGAFMALDALRLLADGGNTIAEHLFNVESRRLGLTERFYSHGVRDS